EVRRVGEREKHLLGLAWAFQGGQCRNTAGGGGGGGVAGEFVTHVERFVPHPGVPVVVQVVADSRQLSALFLLEGELLRAEGPGLPGRGTRAPFYVVRARGRAVRLVTVLEPMAEAAHVLGVRVKGGVIEVETTSGVDRHTPSAAAWEIASGATRLRLAGARDPEPPLQPLVQLDPPKPAVAAALRVDRTPPLDGTCDGFDAREPLRLDLEDQYRRSEEPYSGPEDFSAVAY